MTVAQRVLRYVKGTTELGLFFKAEKSTLLQGYCDSDWAGSQEDMKSTSGYLFKLGGAIISWQTQKQEVVAQSTVEAEYMSATATVNQTIWLRNLLESLGFKQEGGTPIFCDNSSAIAIGKNPVQHRRTKHINIKFHVVREAENNGTNKLKFCKGEDQLADIFTKSLPTTRFEELTRRLGLKTKWIKEE